MMQTTSLRFQARIPVVRWDDVDDAAVAYVRQHHQPVLAVSKFKEDAGCFLATEGDIPELIEKHNWSAQQNTSPDDEFSYYDLDMFDPLPSNQIPYLNDGVQSWPMETPYKVGVFPDQINVEKLKQRLNITA